MNSEYDERIRKLDNEVVDSQGLLEYWLGVCDLELLEEAPSRIAMIETDLESLLIERKALLEDIKARD